MKKQIITNLASNYALNFFGMILGFFLVPFLIGKLGAGLYGIIVLTESTIAFFEIFTISIRQAMSRHATFAYAQNRMAEFVEYLSTSLCILYVVAFFVAVIGAVIAFYFPVLFKVPLGYELQSQWHFFMISGSVALSILNIPYWSALYSKQRFDLINAASSIGLIIRAFCIFAFYSFAPKEQASLAAYGFIFLAMMLGQNSLIYYWHRKLFPDLKLKLRQFKPEKVREILSFSTHTSLSRASSLLYQNAANILINVFWGPSMNTIYSVALKLPNMVYRIFVETSWVLAPTFTDLAARNERDKIKKLLLIFSKLLATATFPLLWMLLLLSHPIIRAWVGPGFEMAGDLMPFYVIVLFFSIPASFAGSVTSAYAKVKLPSYLSISMAILNLFLCFLLGVTFHMKLSGIALASVATAAGMNLFFYPVYACRIAGAPIKKYFLESLGKPLGFSALLIGGSLIIFMSLGHGQSLTPGLFVYLAILYTVYLLSAYRWLLGTEEKKYLRETASATVKLVYNPIV